MHCASQAGHLTVVKLLVESGSPTTAETSNGRTPLWFAASENKLKVVTYLIQREHDSYKLLEDRKVLMRPFLVAFIHSDKLFKNHPKIKMSHFCPKNFEIGIIARFARNFVK